MSTEKKLHPGINIAQTDPKAHLEAEPVMFGFWVFLMSDLVLFTLLLATYGAMSVHGMAGGPTPKQVTDLTSAGIETALLLASSFTFALASIALKYDDNQRALKRWLIVTALLGAGFIGMEIKDFITLAGKGQIPQVSGFLSAHYALLGTHMLHVASAIVWMAMIWPQMKVPRLKDLVRLRIMRLALFWHMLDVVWVAIVTFVFLFGAST